jgi:hypothetical protein
MSKTYLKSDHFSGGGSGLLTKAFMRVNEPKLRRRIVDLVEEIAGEEG